MKPLAAFLMVLASFWMIAGARAGDAAVAELPPPKPEWLKWEFADETGLKFDFRNPNHYITAPQLLLMRYQPAAPRPFFSTPYVWIWQHEVGIAAVPILHGPEDHYFGITIGPRFSFKRPGSPLSFYIEGRFATGAIDSTGPPHGQGQDLTFSAFGGFGLMYDFSNRLRVGAGVEYEHFSNAGLSEPEVTNVGLDTIGPNFSLMYKF